MSTNSWHQFLDAQGAHWDHQGISHFGDNQYPCLDTSQAILVDLSTWAGLRVRGADARKFLQGQVTCDMNLVTQQYWQRGTHCNIKGRAVFSFHCVQLESQADETFVLLMPKSTIEIALENLKKYAVFSKVSLSLMPDLHLLGLIGSSAQIQTVLNTNLAHDQTVFRQPNTITLTLPGDRFLHLGLGEESLPHWQALAPLCKLQGYSSWNLASIRAGMGEIDLQTSGELLPQLLNFHLTHGISFTKGCYLGQEVVARMEYRGKLKRHMRRALISTAQAPQANDTIFGAESEQSIGNIICAVRIDPDTIECLAAVTDQAVENDDAFLGPQKCHKLQFLPLPYAITK